MKSFIYRTTLLLISILLLFVTTDNGSLTSGIDHSNDAKIRKSPAMVKTTNNKSTTSRVKDTTSAQSLDSSDWFSKVQQTIKEEEYHITYSEGVKAYQSPNRAQNLRFIYTADGFIAKPRTTKIPLFDQSDRSLREEDKTYRQIENWQVKLQVAGYGRTAQFKSFVGKNLTANKNSAYIEDQGLKIAYENNEDGMRQNFVIKEKPEGNGLLKLKITAETPLTLRVGPDAIVFVNTPQKRR